MATSKSKAKMYVAVIITGSESDDGAFSPNARSERPWGDWASFVGPDRDEVIERAIRARDQWQRGDAFRAPGANTDRYDILVGTLDSTVEIPTNYELVPLQ